MAKVLVFQHVAAEPLGTLDALIRRRGHRIRFINFDRDPEAEVSVTRYDGLIILGGPMMVSDRHRLSHLKTEIRAIEKALQAEMPILGICLGSQLLAHTLGAEVQPIPQPEIGWYPLLPTADAASDPVLAALNGPTPMFQWHSQGFTLPAGATPLASSSGWPHQAFRYANAWGFQFHLEMEYALVQRWLGMPAYRAEVEATEGCSVAGIEADTQRHMGQLNALAHAVFNPFLDRVGPPRRRVALPSR